MGDKFGSINIKGAQAEAIQSLVPDFVAREVMPGWVTVVSESEFFECDVIYDLGQQLMETVHETMLVVECFEEEYLVITLYRDGRMVQEMEDDDGDVKEFVDALSSSPEDAETLSIILAEPAFSKRVALLESFLGCPIFIDAIMSEHLEIDGIGDRDPFANRDLVNNYMLDRKKESEIDNQTNLILRSGKEGGPGAMGAFAHPTCLPVVYRADQPSYPKGHYPVEFYDIDSNGILHSIFDANIAEGMGLNSWICRAHGITLLACDSSDVELAPDGINCLMKAYINIFSDDGEQLDKLDAEPFLNIHNPYAKPLLIDDSRFFAGGKCYNFRQRRIEWTCSPDIGTIGWSTPVLLPNGNLLCQYQRPGTYEYVMSIIKPNGEAINQIPLYPSHPHWKQPAIYRDNIICMFAADHRQPLSDRLVCYDFSLNERWRYELPESSAFMEPVIDKDSGTLYFQRTSSITAAFDLERRMVIAESDDIELKRGKYRSLEAFLPGIGLVCRGEGTSGIDVLSPDFKLISHHMTKGDICFFTQRDERLFILSCQPEECLWEVDAFPNTKVRYCTVNKSGHTYVYELGDSSQSRSE